MANPTEPIIDRRTETEAQGRRFGRKTRSRGFDGWAGRFFDAPKLGSFARLQGVADRKNTGQGSIVNGRDGSAIR